MKTTSPQRRFKLRIWWLALGYFAFYVPYSFLIKIVTNNFWPGINEPVSGFRLLPGVVVAIALLLPLIITYQGWWKYATRRPHALVVLSGLGTAIIIGTTTLAFAFTGVSIIFALLLMRGGVLIIAPAVDLMYGRRVRWFSWAALALAIPALFVALADVNNYRLTTLAAITIGSYLSGYLLRIPCLTAMAKIEDKETTRRYFVEEAVAAILFLLAITVTFALLGQGEISAELRRGFLEPGAASVAIPALLIGALYAALYCFGTLIYLDCRENTFCIPLNRSSSLLAGVISSFALALLFGFGAPSEAQLASAAMIVVAILFLSPLHHLDRYLAKLRLRFAPAPVPERLFLFVCSGNTCRSPMAAAIANAEIAKRLGISPEAIETVNVRALSAGVSAPVGAPLTAEAAEILHSLSVPVKPHAARNLTLELAQQAELIFCMTRAHRNAVIEMLPSVALKTRCLDVEADVDDPIGKGMPAYLACARQIQRLVQLRFDEIDLLSPA
jgi:protein-tyrosine-phosphatase